MALVSTVACRRMITRAGHTAESILSDKDLQLAIDEMNVTVDALTGQHAGNDCSRRIVMPCDCEKTTFNWMICDKRVGSDQSQCSVSAFGCTFSQLCPDYCGSSPSPSPTDHDKPSPSPSPDKPSPSPSPSPDKPSDDPDSWGMPCDTRNDCCSATLCPGFTPPAGDTVTGHRPNCKCSNGCTWGRACGRDAVVAANNYFQPKRHCGEGGQCDAGSWTNRHDTTSPRYCLIYNDGKLVPEHSQAGYCMGVYEKAYADFIVTVNSRTTEDFEQTLQWMMSPANEIDPKKRSSCTDDSFCMGHGGASGEIGKCQCSSTGSSSIAVKDLDRFSSILSSECSNREYCSGRGAATFSSGTCSCQCDAGFSGNHCELADGEACTDFEDCFGHGYASGIRPNCQCDCKVEGLASTHQFTGAKCDQWKWGRSSGFYTHQISLRSASEEAEQTASPTPSSKSGACKSWCATSQKSWTQKCNWSKCSGCGDCQ